MPRGPAERALCVLLGLNIVGLRRRAGLTQGEAAVRAAFRSSAFSQFERGKQEPRLGSILRICGAIEATGAELLGDLPWSPTPSRSEERADLPVFGSQIVVVGGWEEGDEGVRETYERPVGA